MPEFPTLRRLTPLPVNGSVCLSVSVPTQGLARILMHGTNVQDLINQMTCQQNGASGLGRCHTEPARPLYQGFVTQHCILLQRFIMH
jgi:hypothetical protein